MKYRYLRNCTKRIRNVSTGGTNKTKSFPDIFNGFDSKSYRPSERRRKMQEEEISSLSFRNDALTLPREFECTVINETQILSLSWI